MALLWEKDGTVTGLDKLAGAGGIAGNHGCAVNNQGGVVGHFGAAQQRNVPRVPVDQTDGSAGPRRPSRGDSLKASRRGKSSSSAI